MKHPCLHIWAAAASLSLCWTTGAVAQALPQAPVGTLRLVVKDQTGAVLPAALVRVTRADEGSRSGPASEVQTDGQGVAVAEGLRTGRYVVEVSFPGFETRVITDVRVRSGENRREVMLGLQKLDENVSVRRDPETAASDPNSARLGAQLTKEQIDALPDDPDELERVLQEMAGPGGTIRVDGFRGGRLPPKSQIRSIRFAAGMFAAENHGGGMTFVDIATQPGLGPMRGNLEFTFRDDALNARNAFQPAKTPEATQQYGISLSGTLLKDKTSFSLSAGGASLYDSANIFAAGTDGSRSVGAVRRPSDRINLHGRIDHALTASHTLRGTYQQNDNDQRNLGIGGFDLPERAFRRTSNEHVLRVSESGPWARAWSGESRLQVRWADVETASRLEARTERVLDAFTAGGAQQAGARRSTDIELATNIDWARGAHALRMGALVEGGRYRSDAATNYIGTYTFASLADFQAGRPALYTQQKGNPLVEYSHMQAGVYIQDDWRARRNLTLSAGLRQEFQTHMGDRLNLAPRAGFTWSPFRHGRTTVRGGGGIFYDWLEAETYEQTLRVDGVRGQEVVVRNPGYPDPFDAGASEVLPASKYALAESLVMPTRHMGTLGLSQQLSSAFTANINVTHMTGTNRLRGRNINAPREGLRPDQSLGNVTQVESTGRMESRHFQAGLNINLPDRRTFIFANYSFTDQKNDADGPFSLPADSYDLAAEWGPAAGLPRHMASAILNTPIGSRIRIGLTATARSATRYNITTGRDDNGDTVFTDRPAGVARNSALGHGMWDAAARVSYTFGFGERRTADGPGGPQVVVVQRGAPASAGDLLGGPMGGAGAENKRIRIELFATAQNLFNTVTPTGYSGVMTSQFFGGPTAALPGRRFDIGLRLGF